MCAHSNQPTVPPLTATTRPRVSLLRGRRQTTYAAQLLRAPMPPTHCAASQFAASPDPDRGGGRPWAVPLSNTHPSPPLRSPFLPLGESARWSCVLLLVRVCVGCEEDCFPEKKNAVFKSTFVIYTDVENISLHSVYDTTKCTRDGDMLTAGGAVGGVPFEPCRRRSRAPALYLKVAPFEPQLKTALITNRKGMLPYHIG